MTFEEKKEHSLYLVKERGRCVKWDIDLCKSDACPNAKYFESCTTKDAYKAACEWLLDNRCKEDLLEQLI